MEAEKTETTIGKPVVAEGEQPQQEQHVEGTEGGAKLSKNEQKRL